MAAKTFMEVLKFNPNHGPDGRFAPKNGGASSSGAINSYIDNLKPDVEYDNRVEHWKKQIQAGNHRPVLVSDSDLNRVVDGNHTLAAYQELGQRPEVYAVNRIQFLNEAAAMQNDLDWIKDAISSGKAKKVTEEMLASVQKALTFEEILKFNPYHDSRGRFATANGATSMTYAPGKSKAHDNAIQREKEKRQETAAAGGKEEPKQQKYSREEQVEAIEDWTLSDYQEIRAVQCGNGKGSAEYQEKLRKKGEAIEEYISSNPSYEGEIYRGIYMDNPATPKVGQILDMQGTSSWSADEYVAQHFAGAAERKTFSEHAYVFKMRKAPAQSADIDDISRNHGELEVLVSKNVKFKVTGVETTKTHTVITVEEA